MGACFTATVVSKMPVFEQSPTLSWSDSVGMKPMMKSEQLFRLILAFRGIVIGGFKSDVVLHSITIIIMILRMYEHFLQPIR